MKPGAGAKKPASPRSARAPIVQRLRLQPPLELHDAPGKPLELVGDHLQQLGRAHPAGIAQTFRQLASKVQDFVETIKLSLATRSGLSRLTDLYSNSYTLDGGSVHQVT